MKILSRSNLVCLICVLSASAVAVAQGVPVQSGSPLYAGFQMPTAGGNLSYALNVGERLSTGYGPQIGTVSATVLSGDVGFITPSARMPTTVRYTGGYLFVTYGQPSAFFHDFLISQAYITKRWHFDVSDTLTYLPETPTAGIFGIVGTGTATGVTNAQGVIIPFATQIANTVLGDATFSITPKTAATATGFYALQRFPGLTGGIQTDVYSGQGGVTHRVDAVSSWGTFYTYNNFSYVSVPGAFETQGVTGQYKRQLNRKFSVSLAAGPSIISASSITKQPTTLTYSVDAQVTYQGNVASGFLVDASFIRSTTGGSGITFGSTDNTVSLDMSRRLTRSMQVTAMGNYTTTSGLLVLTSQQVNSQTAVGSVQLNRAFTRTLSAYASYSAQHQAIQGLYVGVAPLIGLQQTFGFGVTYSPSPIHLGR